MDKKESLNILEFKWNREHKKLCQAYLRNQITHKKFINESFKVNCHYKAKIDELLPRKFRVKSK